MEPLRTRCYSIVVSVREASLWGGKALPGQDDLPYDDGEPVETGFHHA